MSESGEAHDNAPSILSRSRLDNGERGDGELSLLGAVALVLRYRLLIVGLAFGVCALVETVLLMQHSRFTSASSFMQQSRRNVPSLSGIAAQFGLFVPGGDASESPAFYADLVTSREILGAVVDSRAASSEPFDSVALARVLGLRARRAAERREEAIRALRRVVNAEVSLKTGVVNLRVTCRDSMIAFQINRRILALVNTFNLEKRQSQAAAERRFTERRLEEVRGDLRSAEDRLKDFLQQNRDYRNSPELTFQQDRLARDVSMQQQIYTSLSQAFEQARIEEVRDTPVLTVVGQPEVPVQPDPKGFAKQGVLGFVIGALMGLILAFVKNLAREASGRTSEELTQLKVLLGNTFRDVLHPLRAITRARSSILAMRRSGRSK